jgi:hypothetical protein
MTHPFNIPRGLNIKPWKNLYEGSLTVKLWTFSAKKKKSGGGNRKSRYIKREFR